MYLFIIPWVLIVIQTENLRARALEGKGGEGGGVGQFVRVSGSMTSRIPSCHPSPRVVVCQLHLHYGILIYFRFSMWVKRQSREPSGRLLREQSQILPIDSGESPPFLIDESPQFHAISCPPPTDKVQSCFAVKETAFQFGCSNFPAGRTRSYTSMGWSVAISIVRNHSKLLREHGVCQSPAFSLVFLLSQSVAHNPLFVLHAPADSNCPLHSSSSI